MVFLLYGGMLWGVLPSDAAVSWQAHLGGALGGLLAARSRGAEPTDAGAVTDTADRHCQNTADPSQTCNRTPPSRHKGADALHFCDGSAVLQSGLALL